MFSSMIAARKMTEVCIVRSFFEMYFLGARRRRPFATQCLIEQLSMLAFYCTLFCELRC